MASSASPPIPSRPPRFFSLVERLGQPLTSLGGTVGAMAILLGDICRRAAKLKLDGQELLFNMHKMGVRSLPIVVVTALFAGALMVVQATPIVERVGATGLIGWAAGFTTLREIAPLLTALMINGRVGANNTAELGTMVVTEQVDALRVLAIDPIAFLIGPRFCAMVLTLLFSTVFSDALALIGASIAAKVLLGIDGTTFYNGVTSGLLGIGDVLNGIGKSAFFGVMIGLSSCHYGLRVEGGAPGVGKAVNATVVASAAGIFVIDYILSFILG